MPAVQFTCMICLNHDSWGQGGATTEKKNLKTNVLKKSKAIISHFYIEASLHVSLHHDPWVGMVGSYYACI